MTIPSQTDMFAIVLEIMQDGAPRSRKEIKDAVRDSLGLTPEECRIKTSSKVPVYESRAGWGIPSVGNPPVNHPVVQVDGVVVEPLHLVQGIDNQRRI